MRPDHIDADVAVVGSGFSGSLMAMCLRRRGRRVVLIERGRHPRFTIGESSTPLANLLLEELCDRYELPRIRSFSKWGTWQRAHPDVGCGLKRGFTFFFHRLHEAFGPDQDHAQQLLVAASPHDDISDTHWYRPDFDEALVHEAEAEGVIYLDDTRIDRFLETASGVEMAAVRHSRDLRIAAGFLVDASGPRGFLHRALGLEEGPLRWLPATQGLYTHFEKVQRWDSLTPVEAAPYPVDAAAVHHVFHGGWIWVLRFGNGITSAGAALRDQTAAAIQASDGKAAWSRLLSMLPSVGEQFRAARPTLPFVHVPRLAFRSRIVCGERWAMLPSAAGVIDPLLSTGFPLTLLGVTRLLELLENASAGSERTAALQRYARISQDELDATERLVAALYANLTEPLTFKRLALLYFAAASYSEAARRLGRAYLAPGFLLSGHSRFGPELNACAEAALARPAGDARAALFDRVDRAIEPFDVAGLLDRSRRDWHPVRAEDLMTNRQKLEATRDEVIALLERTGFSRDGPASSPAAAQSDRRETVHRKAHRPPRSAAGSSRRRPRGTRRTTAPTSTARSSWGR